jgi:hypothetical protein
VVGIFTSTICTAANFSSALRGESGREGFQLPSERDVQAVREEGDEHMRLDAVGLWKIGRIAKSLFNVRKASSTCTSCR